MSILTLPNYCLASVALMWYPGLKGNNPRDCRAKHAVVKPFWQMLNDYVSLMFGVQTNDKKTGA